MRDHVYLEAMPLLTKKIKRKNATELVEQLYRWESDLIIPMITAVEQKDREALGMMIQDMFEYYRGVVQVLATGKSRRVEEYRQLGAARLAETIAVMAHSECVPDASVVSQLALCLARVTAEERAAAHDQGREEERKERRGAIERAVRGALSELDQEVTA